MDNELERRHWLNWIKIILQLVSAAPEIYESIRSLWDLLSKVKDKNKRGTFKTKIRRVVRDSIDHSNKTFDHTNFKASFDAVTEDVENEIKGQR